MNVSPRRSQIYHLRRSKTFSGDPFLQDQLVERLEHEQVLLQSILAQVNKELRSVKLEQAQLHNSRSPLSRLPPEILSQIFIFLYGFMDTRPWQFPGLSVCHYWRSCILSTPLLWSSFAISSNNLWSPDFFLDLASRSGVLPCRLVIFLAAPLPLSIPLRLQEYLDRCRNLELQVPQKRNFEECAAHRISFPLPSLRELKIAIVDTGEPGPEVAAPDDPEDSSIIANTFLHPPPRLESLVFDLAYQSHLRYLVPATLSTLANCRFLQLQGNRLPDRRTLELLPTLHFLETLDWVAWGKSTHDQIPAVIRLPRLKKLRLCGGIRLTEILAAIEAPKLRYLSLSGSENKLLKRLLNEEGKFPELHRLGCVAYRDQNPSAFLSLPGLTELRLGYFVISSCSSLFDGLRVAKSLRVLVIEEETRGLSWPNEGEDLVTLSKAPDLFVRLLAEYMEWRRDQTLPRLDFVFAMNRADIPSLAALCDSNSDKSLRFCFQEHFSQTSQREFQKSRWYKKRVSA